MDQLSPQPPRTLLAFLDRLRVFRQGSLRAHVNLTPYLYILPSFLFLSAILGVPILYGIGVSFQDYTLASLVSNVNHSLIA